MFGELVFPDYEGYEENNADDQQYNLVRIIPSSDRSLAIDISWVHSRKSWDVYFQTKLKIIRPLTPRIEPIQSIQSE